jgi:hypothetical protein
LTCVGPSPGIDAGAVSRDRKKKTPPKGGVLSTSALVGVLAGLLTGLLRLLRRLLARLLAWLLTRLLTRLLARLLSLLLIRLIRLAALLRLAFVVLVHVNLQKIAET